MRGIFLGRTPEIWWVYNKTFHTQNKELVLVLVLTWLCASGSRGKP